MSQTTSTFSSVYLVADQTLAGPWTVILFNIVETDGADASIYNSATGEFTAPVSGWYDIDAQLQTSAPLGGIRFVKNGDTNFPPIGVVPSGTNSTLRLRCKLGIGETIRVEGLGGADILALAGTVPESRASNAIFTLIKSFDVGIF